MRPWRTTIVTLALAGLAVAAAEPLERSWSFEDAVPGALPGEFRRAVGDWSVRQGESGKVLAQTASNDSADFNLVLVEGKNAKDLDLSVKLKAVAGEIDQGGGLVWRARDPRNYYVARYNPLEDNFRVYKVVDGVRSRPLGNADVKHHDGWTTLRVTMKGDHVVCFLDGKSYLDVNDPTFPDSGKIGLWSKADARTEFDDLKLVGD